MQFFDLFIKSFVIAVFCFSNYVLAQKPVLASSPNPNTKAQRAAQPSHTYSNQGGVHLNPQLPAAKQEFSEKQGVQTVTSTAPAAKPVTKMETSGDTAGLRPELFEWIDLNDVSLLFHMRNNKYDLGWEYPKESCSNENIGESAHFLSTVVSCVYRYVDSTISRDNWKGEASSTNAEKKYSEASYAKAKQTRESPTRRLWAVPIVLYKWLKIAAKNPNSAGCFEDKPDPFDGAFSADEKRNECTKSNFGSVDSTTTRCSVFQCARAVGDPQNPLTSYWSRSYNYIVVALTKEQNAAADEKISRMQQDRNNGIRNKTSAPKEQNNYGLYTPFAKSVVLYPQYIDKYWVSMDTVTTKAPPKPGTISNPSSSAKYRWAMDFCTPVGCELLEVGPKANTNNASALYISPPITECNAKISDQVVAVQIRDPKTGSKFEENIICSNAPGSGYGFAKAAVGTPVAIYAADVGDANSRLVSGAATGGGAASGGGANSASDGASPYTATPAKELILKDESTTNGKIVTRIKQTITGGGLELKACTGLKRNEDSNCKADSDFTPMTTAWGKDSYNAADDAWSKDVDVSTDRAWPSEPYFTRFKLPDGSIVTRYFLESAKTITSCSAVTKTFYSEANAIGEKRACKFTWPEKNPGESVEAYSEAGNGVIRAVCGADGEWKEVKMECTRLHVDGN